MAIDRRGINTGINTSSLQTQRLSPTSNTKRLAQIVGAKSMDTLTVDSGVVATTGPSLGLGPKAGLAVVGVGALGAIWYFFLRKPKANLGGCPCR